MKNLEVLYLISTSIEQCQPKHQQNHQKVDKLKQSNKRNKNILIPNLLKFLPELLPEGKIRSLYIYLFQKYVHNQLLALKSVQDYIELLEHSRQIAGKQPPLTCLMHIGIEIGKNIAGRLPENSRWWPFMELKQLKK